MDWRVWPAPILVTGVPRSGTTWLARELAQARRTALPGREPMNPRGSQYALGATLDAWVRLTDPSSRQRRILRRSYSGRNLMVYSRYGHRQWAASLPWTRVIVKDPFAMLSIPAVAGITGATPVLVYRHPAAVLASYRRMGWTADLEEAQAVINGTKLGLRGLRMEADRKYSDAERMAQFWSILNEVALEDVLTLGSGFVVSHGQYASGGEPARQRLFALLDLGSPPAERSAVELEGSVGSRVPVGLHDFDRSPESVAVAWRSDVDRVEVDIIEQIAGPTFERLERARVALV